MGTIAKKIMGTMVVTTLWMTASPFALAGGVWSGGGGEILEHARNPWFLDVTGRKKPVTYCISVGPDFPVSLSYLESLVSDTINWWHTELGNAHFPRNTVIINNQPHTMELRVQTTGFVRQSCLETTDLAIQFGALSTTQRDEFKRLAVDTTRFVALTIRTDYDEALRGRGFIYVSPDRGPDSFQSRDRLTEVWSDDYMALLRLKLVLIHEFGHVFGLGHDMAESSIMSARLPEYVVSRQGALNSGDLYQNTSLGVFFPKFSQFGEQFCRDDRPDRAAAFRKFFLISDDYQCFQTRLSLGRFAIDVKTDKNSSHWILHGKADFPTGGKRRHKQLVNLWVPAVQTLFPGLSSLNTMLNGPAATEVLQNGNFSIERSPEQRQIFLEVTPRYLQIGGFDGDTLIPDLLPVSDYGRVISGWQD